MERNVLVPLVSGEPIWEGDLDGREEVVGSGGKAKLEEGQGMKRSVLTFRSSLKVSAVAVKCGMAFLQCGHPA